MQTITEIRTPVLYPAVQEFLNDLVARGGPPLYELSPQDRREVLRTLQAIKVARLPAEIEDRACSPAQTNHVLRQALAR